MVILNDRRCQVSGVSDDKILLCMAVCKNERIWVLGEGWCAGGTPWIGRCMVIHLAGNLNDHLLAHHKFTFYIVNFIALLA